MNIYYKQIFDLNINIYRERDIINECAFSNIIYKDVEVCSDWNNTIQFN